jgi:hypothetical protein
VNAGRLWRSLPIRATIAFVAALKKAGADFVVTLNPKNFPQAKLTANVVSRAQFLGMVQGAPAKG